MINENQEYKYHANPLNVVVGMLIGGLAGAVTIRKRYPNANPGKRPRTARPDERNSRRYFGAGAFECEQNYAGWS
jgi:hypothetical protein